ncbi:hypothetical protein Zmor_012060 [Zophobas morio]|uniref:Reverse transcriptase domain-containing protein n=1 Tax=Zophobas morio TaxID=2755281 RepID=A0AA38LYL9_9CUCU|nr:hypothetical protein Zmor_012060 [Zophobas morio]
MIPWNLKTTIGLRLKFCPTPPAPTMKDYQYAFDNMTRGIHLAFQLADFSNNFVKTNIYVPNKSFIPDNVPEEVIDTFGCLKINFLDQDRDFYKNRKLFRWNLESGQRVFLKEFKDNKHLKVINTDKNQGPALMTTMQYVNWCTDHLQINAYLQIQKCNKEEILTMCRDKILGFYQQVRRKMGKNNEFMKLTRIILHDLYKTKLSYFYGLAKVHKKDFPRTAPDIRPLVACVNTPITGLSKWLHHYLLPIVETVPSYIRNSDDILTAIQDTILSPHHEIMSLDISALYTSIPIMEAFRVIKKYILEHYGPIHGGLLVEALHLILNTSYFEFYDKLYIQTNGIPMGNPAAPSIATLYVAYYESIKLYPLLKSNLILYKRYLDDTLVILNDNGRFLEKKMLAILNSIPGLKWTKESMKDGKLQFLDICIHTDGKMVWTTSAEKDTNLFLYPTPHSAHPPGVVKGMVRSLISKYYRQNSFREDFCIML